LKVVALEDAVGRHVRAGDALHVMTGSTRWTAAARETVRQWWDRDPRFTLVMLSLSSLGTLFFRGGLVAKVITGYSGDTFPNFTPNPVFQRAYESGAVAVEHWSFLAFTQRLEAAARGVPAIVTRSIAGSSMANNDAYATVPSPFAGDEIDPEIGLLAPLAPDVALLHAPLADAAGNVAVDPPLLEGVWGALAARRGAIVTVERIVDDIRPWSHLVRLPAHKVLAVCEAPFGAHPGGLYARDLPVDGYGEDYDFWMAARAALRDDGTAPAWIDEWVHGCPTHADYVARLGDERRARLRARAAPDSWRADAEAHPPDFDAPANAWECAAVWGARAMASRIAALGAHAVLAGAGVANLSAWLAVAQARAAGSGVVLTAELGLWGYEPTAADPFVFNHRSFPSATMAGQSTDVLGMLVGGPGTVTLALLGAAQIDRRGNINSTTLQPDGPFLVGSGGGNDVASTCAEALVVATMTRRRMVDALPYVTSPGRAVQAVATDLGMLEKRDGELVLTAVAPGVSIEGVRGACGWDLIVADEVDVLTTPTADEIAALRTWDPTGLFLRAG